MHGPVDEGGIAVLARAIANAANGDAAITLLQKAFSDPVWTARALTPMLSRLRSDPMYQPPVAAKRAGGRIAVMLHNDAAFSLSARIVPSGISDADARQSHIVLSGRRSIVCYLRAKGGMLHRWRLHGARLCAAEPMALADHMVVACDGRYEAHHAVAATDEALVEFIGTIDTDRGPHIREFSAASGELLRVGTSSLDASRRHMLLTLLRATGRDAGTRAFDTASRHPEYFLRWEAVREWLGHDAAAALPRLREMAADDPAADLRSAAAKMALRVEARIAAAAQCRS